MDNSHVGFDFIRLALCAHTITLIMSILFPCEIMT